MVHNNKQKQGDRLTMVLVNSLKELSSTLLVLFGRGGVMRPAHRTGRIDGGR